MVQLLEDIWGKLRQHLKDCILKLNLIGLFIILIFSGLLGGLIGGAASEIAESFAVVFGALVLGLGAAVRLIQIL